MGMALLELTIRVEKHFGLKDDSLLQFPVPTTVGELYDHLMQCIARRESGSELASGTVWNDLARIVSELLRVPLSEVRREARLIEDLGAD